jgi:hypothetical protein
MVGVQLQQTYAVQSIQQCIWQLCVYEVQVLRKQIGDDTGICGCEKSKRRSDECSQCILVEIGTGSRHRDDENGDSKEK